MDLTLVTCRSLPEADPDAAPLNAALDAAGFAYRTVAWDDPSVDWALTPLTVIRSTWDYPLHRNDFVAWAERISLVTRLCNSAQMVRWNSHKSYLLELEEQGIPITPTAFFARGADVRLAQIMDERGWNKVVVKPAVSCASYRTYCVDGSNMAEGQAHLLGLLAEGDMLVQQYLPSVEDYGERALVWIDGRFTHAVRKTARFEGQEESVSDAVEFSSDEVALAEQVLNAADEPLLYARVDMAPGPAGTPVLMELELIEPSLFFNRSRTALNLFVAGMHARLSFIPS
jgi:hypothetical protein